MNKERNFKVWAIGIGVITIPSGKTKYDWSIYDRPESNVYLTSEGFLLYASPDSFQIGDKYALYGNDSQRSLSKSGTIIDKCECNKETVIEMLFKHGYDYRQLRAFRKKQFSKKLTTSYSVKGHEYLN
jgi:hypothetical protein